MSRGETQPRGGAGELEDEEGRGVMGTARYEADKEVLLGWNEDLPLCLQEDCFSNQIKYFITCAME